MAVVRHGELAQWIESNNIREWINRQRFFGRPG